MRKCVATLYLPPRRDADGLIESLNRVAGMDQPTYMIGDLNALHNNLTQSRTKHKNAAGNIIAHFIGKGKILHLGPDFKTYMEGGNTGTPDIILTNTKSYHNRTIERGPATSSDHLPVIMLLDCRPIRITIKPRFATNKTNWDKFKEICNEYEGKSLEGGNSESLNNEMGRLLNKIKQAKIKTTPKQTSRTIPGIVYTTDINNIILKLKHLLALIDSGYGSRDVWKEYKDKRQQLREKMIEGKQKLWDEMIEKTWIRGITGVTLKESWAERGHRVKQI